MRGPKLLALALGGSLVGCADSLPARKCEVTADDPRAVTGDLTVIYQGLSGTAPLQGWRMVCEVQTLDYVQLRGCAEDQGDIWDLGIEVRLALDAARPAMLGDAGLGQIAAFVGVCKHGTCSQEPVSLYGWPLVSPPNTEALTGGTIDALAPGSLQTEATLEDVTPSTVETGRLSIAANLMWSIDAGQLVALDGGV